MLGNHPSQDDERRGRYSNDKHCYDRRYKRAGNVLCIRRRLVFYVSLNHNVSMSARTHVVSGGQLFSNTLLFYDNVVCFSKLQGAF